jgi:phosphoribosylaminoimidazolecarboxamide formyltransferase/IMP cyclohydrolase
MQALVSIFDKKGIVDFAKCLNSSGFTIVSTGGTAKTLADNGIKNIQVCKICLFLYIQNVQLTTNNKGE